MSDTALTAGPFSYSKPCDTSRPAVRQYAATAAGLGGVRLVDLFEHDACVRALVGQHRFQLTPAGVQHRLGHRGFHEFRGADIAHDDRAAALDERAAELVQSFLAPVGDLRVDSPHAGLFPGPLGDSQLRLQAAVETGIIQLRTIAAGGHILQPEVNA
ncbi:hypothetical protein D3C78_1416020 [compost metagenome]